MSSVFTFDPDPPRALSSPWPALSRPLLPTMTAGQEGGVADGDNPPAVLLADFGIDSLEPEPQDGPMEYKLHLLLRPRRSFLALSTVQKVSGSHLSRPRPLRVNDTSPSPLPKTSTVPAASIQSRQTRLQNLTTQLLWRLQQSSPHHASSKSDLVAPVLPEADGFVTGPSLPGRLLPGLEDSQGALYEIGVADDGQFIGLTKDELEESLKVLHAMAFSIGCKVELLRRIVVGDCQWIDQGQQPGSVVGGMRTEVVWVAEALVTPDLTMNVSAGQRTGGQAGANGLSQLEHKSRVFTTERKSSENEQLRVSLTGSTTSGKSSLLGTLSTSTLDNGRGKSRLSLLKHRHEIASGVTSSVTSSLIGYQDATPADVSTSTCADVINYASANVSSWIDIHSASEPGRLIFLNDSAGHPRYRRTTVRGLVSWAPHWTICCIAADNDDDSSDRVGATASASDIFGSSCVGVDLSKAHLELCLKLDLPLIIVITKLDLASTGTLKVTLGKVLSILKAAGRRPEILFSSPSNNNGIGVQMQTIRRADRDEALKLLSSVPNSEIKSLVPIVLTSAVTGRGINKVHSLLRHLPIPKSIGAPNVPDALGIGPSSGHKSRLSVLFHVDEVFAVTDAQRYSRPADGEAVFGSVLSGHLRYGTLAIGDELLVGPFPTDAAEVDVASHRVHRVNSYPKVKSTLKETSLRRTLPRPSSEDLAATDAKPERFAHSSLVWRSARACSMRNLRLPVHALSAGQAGTVGLGISVSSSQDDVTSLRLEDRVRKGMVLMRVTGPSSRNLLMVYSGFMAVFETMEQGLFHSEASVIVYIASVRAPAKIIQSQKLPKNGEISGTHQDDSSVSRTPSLTEVSQAKITFQFLNTSEWFELGSQVLVMPASGYSGSQSVEDKGSQRRIGLEGAVGRITQGIS